MRFTSLVLVILLISGLAWTQTTTQGAIVGTVYDQSGAVVPGAVVKAVNVSTGIENTTKSNSQGDFRFRLLPPGTYSIGVEHEGFQRSELQGIVVGVGTVVRADVGMQMGAASSEITVSSDSVQVNTEDASKGSVIGAEQIRHLPLNGREFLKLAALEAGAVSGNTKRGVHGSKGVDVSFNGSRSGYNSYYVNGAANTDPLYNQMQSSPSLDAVGEFRVMTNMYSAQYGRSGGAVVSIVTKSGTNNFHGTAYEYHRNKALDALPYFFKGERNELSNYLFNQFGGTIGGPIIKKKTFFFFNAEFFRQKKPGQQMVSFAPTAAERQGDFSNTINPYTGNPVQLVNPFTGDPIPGNVLPESLISPIGRKLMEIWPEPNHSGDAFLNLHLFRSGKQRQKKYLTRIDHHFSEKDVISGTFDFNNYDNLNPGMNEYGDKEYVEHSRTWSGSWTHTFTPTLVNDLKGSFSSIQAGDQFALNDKNYCVEWGIHPMTNTLKGTCRILLYTIGYQRYDIGNGGDYKHHNNSFYLKNNLMWTKGNHSFAIGGEFTRDMFNWQYNAGSTEYYIGLLDGMPGYESIYGVTGTVFGDLLTAIPNLINYGLGGTAGSPDMHFKRNVIGGYFEDTWRVKPWLTLTLGIRYDYEEPFANTDNKFMTLDFDTGLPRYSKGAPQDLLELVQFNYETGGPNRPYDPNKTNFAPRFGFAIRPFNDNGTAIRGGYGLFYTTENAFNTMYGSWVAPFQGLVGASVGYAPFWQDNQRHLQTMDQPPYGLDYVRGKSPGFFLPNTPYYPTGYVQQWNLTVNRDLGHKMGLEVGYVGSHGVNLNGQINIQAYSADLHKKVIANNFSNFGLRTKGFNSQYDGLQATFKKATSHGLNLLVNYTWSHTFAQSSNDDALENLFTDVTASGTIAKKMWSQADFDVRHRLTISGGYELPFGRGKAFGPNWNGFLNQVLGGWRSNFIYTFQSGLPYTVYTSALRFPDRTCDGNLPAGERTADRWFDYTCFSTRPPTPYTDPNTGVTTQINLQGDSRPNIIAGPRQNSLDFGIEKYFTIREGHTLQLRAEAFNILNHPNLLSPSGNYFFNSASGAKITTARDGRDIQLALRYSF
ncbi:MAG TPA: TonB-dependent receptor [Terriglobales bacterium]|nr:TonB-dependent receptor [Terriglobales bacterium]